MSLQIGDLVTYKDQEALVVHIIDPTTCEISVSGQKNFTKVNITELSQQEDSIDEDFPDDDLLGYATLDNAFNDDGLFDFFDF